MEEDWKVRINQVPSDVSVEISVRPSKREVEVTFVSAKSEERSSKSPSQRSALRERYLGKRAARCYICQEEGHIAADCIAQEARPYFTRATSQSTRPQTPLPSPPVGGPSRSRERTQSTERIRSPTPPIGPEELQLLTTGLIDAYEEGRRIKEEKD